MKTKIILLVSIFYGILNFAQEQKLKINVPINERPKKTEIKEIQYDFQTNSFVGDSVYRNLKIRDWIKLSVINFPINTTAEPTVIFNNRNLEQMAIFNSFLGFNKQNPAINNESTPIEKLREAKGEVYENLKKNDQKIDENSTNNLNNTVQIKKALEDKASIYYKEKSTKINEFNMIESLEIGDVHNLITKSSADKNYVDKAKKDYDSQQAFVKILQNNITKKLDYRKKIIDSLIEKSTDLNSSITYHFPVVNIENFDNTTFILNITKNSSDKNSIAKVITIPFKNRGGFKLDFSTGFLVTGLNNETYKIVKSDVSNKIQIKQDNADRNKFNTGIALLAHAYGRKFNYINPGISTGVSMNFNTQSINYLAGLSMLVGEDQRFILSAGAIFGKSKTLVDYYITNTDYSETELPLSSDVPLIDKAKASWFVGITYNLGLAGGQKTLNFK